MPVLATPTEFAMQQVFYILLRKPSTKEILAYLTNVKTTGLENTVEMVYPTGSRGNVYIGGGFAHSRRATLNVTNATFNTQVMALQCGTELEKGSTNVTYYEKITAGTDGAVVTKFTAQGTPGAEINYVLKVNPTDGSFGAPFTQITAAPTQGQFTYASATKTISFSDAEKPNEGDQFVVAYTFKSADNAQKITVSGDGIPSTVLATAFGIIKDTCTGDLFLCQLNGLAQVDGNWNFDVAADGDPVVQDFNMEFVKGCLDNRLYDFIIYTEDEDPDAAG